MVQKFWNSIPQLSIAIIILAIIKITLYYYNFDVPIKYFIGISELGLLIADDLLVYIPFLGLLYFLFVEPSMQIATAADGKVVVSDTITTTRKTPGKIRKFLDTIIPWVMLSIMAGFMIVSPIYLIVTGTSFSDRLIGWSFMGLNIFFGIFMFRHETLKRLTTPMNMVMVLFLGIFLLFFIQSVSHEIKRVEGGQFNGTKIVTANRTYISTDSGFYIGQTSRYVFYYNTTSKSTTIIPVSEVQLIELHSK